MNIKMNIEKVFFFKGAKLLIKISELNKNDCYGVKLSKLTNIGYARVYQLLNLFEKEGLTVSEKLDERTKVAVFTKKGKAVVENIISIRRILKNENC